VSEPPDESPAPLVNVGEVEERLLGGPRRHTRDAAAAFADVDVGYVRRLWRAMGFANVGGEAAAFTDGDLLALDRLLALVREGVLDEELAVSVTRALGHNAARLVEWQVDALAEHLVRTRNLTPDEAERQAVDLSAEHLDELEALLVYAWRRQFAAVAGRVLNAPDVEPQGRVLSVGFADLVSYTRLSQRLEQRELGLLVDRFGHLASDVIAGAGGRLVKTVGDEVLFVADSAAAAARIGLDLAEAMVADPELPDVRVGIATGPVLTRMGDVFGRTVNLASRLTALAAPGTVMVDSTTASALAGEEGLVLDVERTRAVRGVGLVRPGVVRRKP
jgi:adenylate cyclase